MQGASAVYKAAIELHILEQYRCRCGCVRVLATDDPNARYTCDNMALFKNLHCSLTI
jgi:hypothetical protein